MVSALDHEAPEARRAQKVALRKQALAAREAVTDRAAKDEAIGNTVRLLIADQFSSAVIAAYLPIRGEVDPMPGLRDHHGQIALPVIIEAASPLIFREWRPGDDLEGGLYKTRHPVASAQTVRPQLILVPLAGFDSDGNRLGYGGGYYDRTLEVLREDGPVTAIGMAYEAQQVGTIPFEATDQPLDGIVTEAGLRRFG